MRRLLIALTVLVLGACASGGGDTGNGNDVASLGDATKTANDQPAPDNKDGEKDREKAMLAFAACMREHGIEMADPDMDGKGGMVRVRPGSGAGAVEGPPDEGKMSAADEACRHHIEGLGGGRGPMDDPAMQDKMVKFAQCMREQGIDMPDPSGEGGRVAIRIQEEDREKLDAAHKACESVAPFKAGGNVEPAK